MDYALQIIPELVAYFKNFLFKCWLVVILICNHGKGISSE